MLGLQDGVDVGLAEVPAQLQPVTRAVLDAARLGRLDALTGEAAAAAVVMSAPDDGHALLLRYLARDAAWALEVALGVCRLHLRFALIGGRLARVLERPRRKPSSHLPQPDFWLALRKALDGPARRAQPRARELALAADLSDLRLRAPVAFAVPDEVSLWTSEHQAQVRGELSILDPVEARLYLFGLLRAEPWAARVDAWPPPARALRSLPPDLLETALALAGDHRALQKLARAREFHAAAAAPGPLLAAPLEDDHLALLGHVAPDAQAITLALSKLAALAELEATLVRALATSWVLSAPRAAEEASAASPAVASTVDELRRTALAHLPAVQAVTSPWSAPRAKKSRRAEPPTPPTTTQGRWATQWLPPPSEPNAEALRHVADSLRRGRSVYFLPGTPREGFQLAWDAWRAAGAPDEPTLPQALEALGPALLPDVARWAKSHPRLLPPVAFVDDGQLAPAWALALSTRRRPVQEAARAWLDAHPRLGAEGVLACLLSADEAERRAGRLALRWLEPRHPDAVAAALSALDEAQRAWVDEVRAEAPSLPAKPPALPDFADVAALPGLALRDGTARVDDDGRRTLLALAKASALDDAEPLLAAAARLSPDALAAFAGIVFTRWLCAGAPAKERWALQLLAHFPSDGWARVLGGLCHGWAQGGFPTRAQDAVEVLSRMASRVALLEVHRLSTKIRTPGLRTKAVQAFEDAALRTGLSQDELEDRLVPDFGLPNGRTLADDVEVDLDAKLKPVLLRAGQVVKALPASASDDARAAWAAVKKGASALKVSAARLERLMVDGRALPGLHFTEVWLMHPLLARIAGRVAWAAFRGAQRVALFVTEPLRTHDGGAFTVDESMTVRPVHPLELSDAEREALRALVMTPAFPQLEREVFTSPDMAAALQQRMGRRVASTQILELERLGWTRGPVVGGGTYITVERRGAGWRVELEFQPGVYLGAPALHPEQELTAARVESASAMTPVQVSELLRSLEFPAARRGRSGA